MEDHQHPLIRIAEALERIADKLPAPQIPVAGNFKCTGPNCSCMKADF